MTGLCFSLRNSFVMRTEPPEFDCLVERENHFDLHTDARVHMLVLKTFNMHTHTITNNIKI